MENQPQEKYTLSVHGASLLFAEAGVPRDERTIRRNCKRGILDSITSDTITGQKYLITKDSVEKRIQQIQQSLPLKIPVTSIKRPDTSGHVQPQSELKNENHFENKEPDVSGHDRNNPDTSGHVPNQNIDSERKKFEEKIKKLEEENLELFIDKKTHVQLNGELVKNQKVLYDDMKNLSHSIGVLETEKKQLQEQLSLDTPKQHQQTPDNFLDTGFQQSGDNKSS